MCVGSGNIRRKAGVGWRTEMVIPIGILVAVGLVGLLAGWL